MSTRQITDSRKYFVNGLSFYAASYHYVWIFFTRLYSHVRTMIALVVRVLINPTKTSPMRLVHCIYLVNQHKCPVLTFSSRCLSNTCSSFTFSNSVSYTLV